MCFETFDIKKRLLRLYAETTAMLQQCDCVFVLLSSRGRKIFFPLLYHLNKKFNKPIYHDAIGGRLALEVERKSRWKKYVNSFRVNWVELPSLQKKLSELGVTNAVTLPNFKRLTVLTENEIDKVVPEVFKFCTFSRVVETKGITAAMEAIQYVNKQAGKKIAELYIYGEVDPVYKEKFERLLKENADAVFYKGAVSFDKSVETIKEYYILLFPTTHPGEGFPGTFIDAYAAGLPIIASDWNYNAELIKEGVTGFCYPWNQPEKFYHLVQYTVDHPEKIIHMKADCLREAEIYSPETVMKTICTQIKKDVGII